MTTPIAPTTTFEIGSTLPAPVAEGLQQPRVAELFRTVETKTPITFQLSADTSWSSSSAASQTTIEYCDCKRPAEALAHELQHAALKIHGYRSYLNAVAKAPCARPLFLPHLLSILDNELQHHKIAPLFAEMALDLRYFYNDSDPHALKKVRRILEKMNRTNTTADFLTQFVTLIAPGGVQSEKEKLQARGFLRSRCSDRTWATLENIEREFEIWRDGKSLDPNVFLQRIFPLLEIGCTFWIGSSTDFPGDGFFVGDPFDLADAEQTTARN